MSKMNFLETKVAKSLEKSITIYYNIKVQSKK